MKYFYIFISFMSVLLTYQVVNTFLLNTRLDSVAPEYIIGASNADLTLVEFLNFNCFYCGEVHPILMAAVQRDGQVRYIPRPIGSNADPDSVKKAALAYGAASQGKFEDIFTDLFHLNMPIDQGAIGLISDVHNMDVEQLKIDSNAQKTKDLIEENNRLFLKTGTNATPTFIIGRKLIYVPTGKMPTIQDFLTMFERARAL